VSPTGPPAGPDLAPPRPREPEPGRAAHTIAQLYYYVVAAVAVGLVLGGLIAMLFGVRTLVLPEETQESRDAVRTMLHGLAFVLPGLALVWWHLREARTADARVGIHPFWGRSLYFYLVAFVSLWLAVGGLIAMLATAVDAALPHCFEGPAALPAGAEPEAECNPEPAEAARRALDGAIFVIAAGPVWWWHLRQGRHATWPRGTE
jgi:hypothetical protein